MNLFEVCRTAVLILFAVASCTVWSQPAASPQGFALLVGVGEYARSTGTSAQVKNLKGPKNDVELMKQLLVEKYSFSATPHSILALVDKQATHKAIASAFRSHLVDNARQNPNAAFVFYFSGHGSQTEDRNGDEGDGVDETLVAHDSRANGGDIVDDEVNDWLAELGKYTRNITVILDSCHSGDATKDVSPEPIVSRGIPPDEKTDRKGVIASLSRRGIVSKEGVGSLTSGASILTGSLPGELSNEGMLDVPGRGKRYQGFLTYYLYKTLWSDPGQTYDQAIRTLDPLVRRHAPAQHPQAEGNTNVSAFGLAGDRESPFIAIREIKPSSLVVQGGEIQGLAAGALVAVYSEKQRRLVGEVGKLANGRVTTVGANSSIVELLDKPKDPITTRDKVAIVTPFFGRYRLPVNLEALAGQTTTAQDKALLAEIEASLKDNLLIERTPIGGAWAIGLQRGCLGDGRELVSAGAAGPPAKNCDIAYYLASRDRRDRPLAELVASGANGAVAGKLADYLGARARLENLRLLVNARSPLNGTLKVSILKSTGSNGVFDVVELPGTGTPRLSLEQGFQIRVSNESKQDLYVAVLALGTGGSVQLLTQSHTGDELQQGKSMDTKRWIVGRPLGIESYKVIATTQRVVDFRVLAGEGARLVSGRASAFNLLLQDLTVAGTRNPTPDTNLSLDDWVTAEVRFEVVP